MFTASELECNDIPSQRVNNGRIEANAFLAKEAGSFSDSLDLSLFKYTQLSRPFQPRQDIQLQEHRKIQIKERREQRIS